MGDDGVVCHPERVACFENARHDRVSALADPGHRVAHHLERARAAPLGRCLRMAPCERGRRRSGRRRRRPDRQLECVVCSESARRDRVALLVALAHFWFEADSMTAKGVVPHLLFTQKHIDLFATLCVADQTEQALTNKEHLPAVLQLINDETESITSLSTREVDPTSVTCDV